MTKKTILTEKAGKKGIRWAIVLTSLPLLVGAGAFAIVTPAKDDAPLAQTLVVNDIVLPLSNTSETLILNKEERIQAGDSLASILARMGVSDPKAIQFLREQGRTQGLQQLRAGKVIQATTDQDGSLLKLSFTDAEGKEVRIEPLPNGEGFQLSRGELTLDYNVAMTAGTIRNSLFGATDAAGLPDDIATELADMFGSEINFHKGLKKGDRFKVVYETYSYQGRIVKTGKLLAAEFVNDGQVYRAVSFTSPDGRTDYYTPEGNNLRKAFLQSPMEFTRVTSGFAMRLHPVLGQWKQHKGVDYGAPTGTKVKVTADGVVSFVGTKNGYGNVVEVKHFGDYSTLYAHLSGFAAGLKVGAKVNQGDLIAYVGQTGWATGPHLHYEFKVAGEAKDPLSTVVPLAMPLDPKMKSRFDAQTNQLVAKFNLMEHTGGKSID